MDWISAYSLLQHGTMDNGTDSLFADFLSNRNYEQRCISQHSLSHFSRTGEYFGVVALYSCVLLVSNSLAKKKHSLEHVLTSKY